MGKLTGSTSQEQKRAGYRHTRAKISLGDEKVEWKGESWGLGMQDGAGGA